MTVNHSIVPRLTRADRLEIYRWNEAKRRSRVAYDLDLMAATRAETGEETCWKCRDGRHGGCTSRARWGTRLCSCWLIDHLAMEAAS